MKNFTFFLLNLFLFCNPFLGANIDENKPWEEWDSFEGLSRLERSHSKENFWKLLRFYESQIRLSHCGVATSVIVLNALSIKPPKSQFLGEYRLFTQEEFFSNDVCAVINQDDVAERGMSLEDLNTVLKVFAIKVFKYEAQNLSQDKIRDTIISALKNTSQCVLAHYCRKELNQEGGGHWSPIAAYDEKTDSFLILDVAKFKYPPVWVEAPLFISAMQTANIRGKSRGFIIIEK